MRFKVGDIVTGKEYTKYGITNRHAIMEVIFVSNGGDLITVKLLETNDTSYSNYIGEKYDVEAADFELVEDYTKPTEIAEHMDMEAGYPWSDAMIDDVVNEFISEVKKYEVANNFSYPYTRKAIERIVYEANQKKGWIEAMLSNHPNFVPEKHMVVLNEDYERTVNPEAVDEFIAWVDINAKGVYVDKYEVDNDEDDYAIMWDSEGHCHHIEYRKRVEFDTMMNFFYSIFNDKHSRVTQSDVDYIKRHFSAEMQEAVRPVVGQKITTIVKKIGKYVGLDKIKDMRTITWTDGNTGEIRSKEKDFGWAKQYTDFCDAITPMKVTRWTIISVNPIDYLRMSIGHKWTSCHTIDKTNVRGVGDHNYQGCYSGGVMSYMLDGSTVEMYVVDRAYDGKDFELQEKIKRCNFHIGHDKIVQGRVYPDGRDGGSEPDIARTMREIFCRVIAECLDVPNLWTVKKGCCACCDIIRTASSATHYRDYENYDDCVAIRLGGKEDRVNGKFIEVGARPICINCGKYHYNQEAIVCESCAEPRTVVGYCENCGEAIYEDEDYVFSEIDDVYFCDADCAVREGYVYSEYDDDWLNKYSCHTHWDDYCGGYFSDRIDEDCVYTVDGLWFYNIRNARKFGCVFTDDGNSFGDAIEAARSGYMETENDVWVRKEIA